MKNNINQKSFGFSLFYSYSIIGLIIIITGIIFLFNPTNINMKIGISLILFGLFIIMIFNVNEEAPQYKINGKQLTIVSILWIFLIFILSYNIDAEIFLIYVILGILLIKEFLVDYMNITLKKRMIVIFYILIILFIILIGQKVINIINI